MDATTTSTPQPLHASDLPYCSTKLLADLTWTYFEDKESLQLVVAELEKRGIDPYA